MFKDLRKAITLITALSLLVMYSGCIGTKSFPNALRAGDSLTMGVGYTSGLMRNNITVTMTAWGNPGTSLDDVIDLDITSAVRAVLYFYPDPTSYAVNYTVASFIGASYYQDPKQAVVMVDIPDPSFIPAGASTITVSSTAPGFSPVTVDVEIISGQGQPSDMTDVYVGALPLNYLEPLPQAEVTFASPSAIGAAELEIDFDESLINPSEIRVINRYFSGGISGPFQTNQNLLYWDDDGNVLRVKILCPQGIANDNHLKFNVVTRNTPGAVPMSIVPGSLRIVDLSGADISGATASLKMIYHAEICDDGADNDFDGLIDVADPDCP